MMVRYLPRTALRRDRAFECFARLAALAIVLCASGCIMFPNGLESRVDHGSHKPIDGELYGHLIEGQTTRAAVHDMVGHRDVTLAADKVWVYSWEEGTDWRISWAAVSPGAAGAGDFGDRITSMHYLLLEFDAGDILLRKSIRHGGRINGMASGLDDAMIKD